MYHQYYGLTEAPFSIAVNPRYLFMSARHRDALAHLLYGVGAGGGFILLTGEVGTGKTTINRCLLEQLPDDTDIAIILNPALDAIELLATVCDELGIEYDAETRSLKTLTDSLHRFLLENFSRGRKTVLLIDEAQHLDFDVLEQIRLLTNLETNSEKLLQIILIGQPELAEKLARPELRQLNQRITARYNLEPLNLEETGAYIRHRLHVAGMGADREIFPPAIVRGIYEATRGIPRVINVLCDRILLGAYGRNQTQADRETLQTAVREVLGEDAPGGFDWRWPVAILGGFALVVTLVVVGGRLLIGGSATDEPATAVVVPEQRVEGATSIETAAVPPQTMAPAAPQPGNAAPVETDTTGAAGTKQAASPSLRTVLLGVNEGMAQLWQWYAGRSDGEACPATDQFGLRCSRETAATWDELQRYQRPLVLSMITAERFAAEALLLGMRGDMAQVVGRDGLTTVPLAELAQLWDGGYRYLWHVPRGFGSPLSLGESGTGVASVARLFAQLDNQPQPLAVGRFNTALEQRVRLFQRQQGLAADGVVGEQTLLRLNTLLGIDPTADELAQRLREEEG